MQRLVLGLGAGQCGLNLLVEILGKQPGLRMTLEQPPLLPWVRRSGLPGLKERFARWRNQFSEKWIGDAASFYLPYVDEAIEADPDVRIICLKRPREEIVSAFCRHLDKNSPFPTNHWAQTPAEGWYHDPLWTQTFPQYETADRIEGLNQYWEEYYRLADQMAAKHPRNFRLTDTDEFTTPEGVRRMLDFVGIPTERQVILTGNRPARPPQPVDRKMPAARYPNPMDPRRCAILVPFSGFIHQECDNALKELERRGYPVRRVSGYAAIDQGRNQMSTDALMEGFDETLWIDSDVGFNPDDVERLRGHQLPIVCGIYPQKGKRALACHVAHGAEKMVFGDKGGLVELLYAATGFLLIRRQVYVEVMRRLEMPVCNERFGHPMFPFFHPMIRVIDDGHWYLAEDYAFCERVRRSGFKIYADTKIRLWHIGTYRYGWEDAGMDRPRFGEFTLNFRDPKDTRARGGRDAETELANFAADYPWPAQRPDVPPPPDRNWLFPDTRKVLADTVSPDSRFIVEVGSWLGRSTRYIADLAPKARIAAIDHWVGSPEHTHDPELVPLLPRLYETFLSESWDYRDRVIPVKAKSVEGLKKVADAGLTPDLIFIDADHSYEAVRADVTMALQLFPKTPLVGDDWDWPGVRQAVEELARERTLKLEVRGVGWRILPT
jgi:hypothetical protein